MSTTTSGKNERPFSIDDILCAIDDFKRIHALPLKEITLHPDDYIELKILAGPHLVRPAPGKPDNFGGVNILVDPNAKRLRRKL